MNGKAAEQKPAAPLLRVRDLTTTFHTGAGPFRAIEDVSFSVQPQEALALVGESGCGKTVTALSIMRLAGPAARTEGEVHLNGTELLTLSDREMREVRGKRISMVFQNPLTALNPALTIGDQIAEVIRAHEEKGGPHGSRWRWLVGKEDCRGEVWRRVLQLLDRVAIPSPKESAERWPHQLSGGMRQRAVIAAALAGSPQLLIADEPTTALDVTVQGQIINLLNDVREKSATAILLISHDFALVAEFADRAAVMYAGQIVELADTQRVVAAPLHPYTRALLLCVPTLEEQQPLRTIPGSVPARYETIPGCRFRERCPIAAARCEREVPALREIEEGHWVRCHLA
ncbi:MAG: ABC transporter ATP-binding protein [Armatimonadota bacterium]